MDAIRNLPKPAIIGIAAAVVLLVFGALMMTVMGGDGTVVVKEGNEAEVSFAVTRLKAEGITGAIAQEGDIYKATVKSGDKQKALLALGVASKADKLGAPKCVAPSTFATGADKKKAANCDKEASIYQQVTAADGVYDASVKVTSFDKEGEDAANATVIIRAEAGMEDEIRERAASIGSIVASSLPATRENQEVLILDNESNTLWNSKTPTVAGGAAGGCGNQITPDLSTKACLLKRAMEKDLTDLASTVVGEGNVKVAATIQLNHAAINSDSRVYKPGVITTRSSQKSGSTGKSGSQSSQSSSEMTPNEFHSQLVKEAGSINSMHVSVVLMDAKPAQQETVRKLINGQMLSRKDTVTVSSTKRDTTAIDAATDKATEKQATDLKAGTDTAKTQAAAQAAMMRIVVFVAILVSIVLLFAVGLLWRRSARHATERQHFNTEFQNDMSRFNHVAERSPDELANEISAWLGSQPTQPGTRAQH